MRWYLRSKIHGAIVTDSNVEYNGSIGICKELLAKSGLDKGEKVHVWNITNGERIQTYVIEAEDGEINVYGSAALKFSKGDKIIICGFELSENYVEPKVVIVDSENKALE